jgi:hypothetical protein
MVVLVVESPSAAEDTPEEAPASGPFPPQEARGSAETAHHQKIRTHPERSAEEEAPRWPHHWDHMRRIYYTTGEQ